MSAFVIPRPTATATSFSRSVSRLSRATAAVVRGVRPPVRTRPITVRVTEGDSIASPSATERIAVTIWSGAVSLSRKPSAPAASASSTNSSDSNVVSTITLGGSCAACSSRVASRPLSTGIRMSIRTRSGSSSSHIVTPARPSPASPTTSMSA